MVCPLSPAAHGFFALFSRYLLFFFFLFSAGCLRALLIARLSPIQPCTVSFCSFVNRYSVFSFRAGLSPRSSYNSSLSSLAQFLFALFSIAILDFLSVLVCLQALLVTRLSPAAPVQPRVPLLTSQHSPPREWIESLNANCRKCLFQYSWKRYGNYLHHRFSIPCPLPLYSSSNQKILLSNSLLFSHLIQKLVRNAHMG